MKSHLPQGEFLKLQFGLYKPHWRLYKPHRRFDFSTRRKELFPSMRQTLYRQETNFSSGGYSMPGYVVIRKMMMGMRYAEKWYKTTKNRLKCIRFQK